MDSISGFGPKHTQKNTKTQKNLEIVRSAHKKTQKNLKKKFAHKKHTKTYKSIQYPVKIYTVGTAVRLPYVYALRVLHVYNYRVAQNYKYPTIRLKLRYIELPFQPKTQSSVHRTPFLSKNFKLLLLRTLKQVVYISKILQNFPEEGVYIFLCAVFYFYGFCTQKNTKKHKKNFFVFSTHQPCRIARKAYRFMIV